MRSVSVIVCLVFVVSPLREAFPQPHKDNPLKVQESQFDVGRLYTYRVSYNENFEDSWIEYYYVQSKDVLESLYISTSYGPDSVGYIERTKFNWQYMMIDKKTAYYLADSLSVISIVQEAGKVNLLDRMDVNYKTRSMSSSEIMEREDGFENVFRRDKLMSFPTYFYNLTGGFDIWFTLKFFSFVEDKIEFSSYYYSSNIPSVITYEGKDKVTVPAGTFKTHEFSLAPRSFFWKILASDANIWLAAEGTVRYMVKYVNENQANPWRRRIEMRLMRREKVSPEKWKAFKGRYTVRKSQKTGPVGDYHWENLVNIE